jgi:hypothetical protein
MLYFNHLKHDIHQSDVDKLIFLVKKAQCSSVTKTNLLRLYWEVIGIGCENHMTHKYVYEQNSWLFNITTGGTYM